MPLVPAARFLDALRHIQLLPAAQLEELTREAPRFPEARALAQHLLERGWLTPYQANQLILERGPDLVLGQYVLLERLGEGVRGQVFKARHRHMKRTVALKVIRKELLVDADAVQRFYLEIQAASQLDHPNVVHAYDAGPIGPSHFLAMEYVKGPDLARLVQQVGPLSIPRACAYVAQAALGLQHAGDRGLVHRDIKPSNLLVDHLPQTDSTRQGELPEGDSSMEDAPPTEATGLYEWGQVKVLDFGLARLQRFVDDPNHPLTHEGAMVGTPDFMAPEQATDAHAVDIRADLYSLGCTLYYLLTGRPPFPGGSYIQKVDSHRWKEPDSVESLRPGIEPTLTAVVRRLMAKRPEDRFQQPAEVAVALANLMGVPIGKPAPPCSAPPKPALELPSRSPARRVPRNGRRWLFLGGAAALAICLAGALFWGIGNRSNPLPHHEVPPAGTAGGDLQRLVARTKTRPVDSEELWQGFLDLSQRYPNTPEAKEATDWLLRIPSPLDRLQARNIPAAERYPTWQPKELVAVLGEHTWRHWQLGPHRIALHPDGQVLASAGDQPEVFIWEAATGRLKTQLSGHKGVIRALAFSPDGKYLASGGADKMVRVWNTGNYALHATLKGHGKDVLSLAFSPHNQFLVSSCGGKMVRVWNLAKGKLEVDWGEERDGVVAVAFAPDNRTVATSIAGGKIRLRDMKEPKQPAATLPGHARGTLALAFAPNETLLTSGGEDGWLRTWDTQTGQETRAIRYGKRITALAFSADGKCLASTSGGPEIRLWDPQSGKELGKPLSTTYPVSSLALSREGKSLWVGTDRLVVLDGDVGGKPNWAVGQVSPIRIVGIAPDCRTVMSCDNQNLTLRDAPSGKVRATVPLGRWSNPSVAISPDGRTLAWALPQSAEIHLLDGSGQPRSKLPGHKGGVQALAFTPDGQTLASIGRDQHLRLWGLTGGKEKSSRRLAMHPSLTCLAFSPDGKLLAFPSIGNTVKVLDLAGNREHATCKGHLDIVRTIAFSPDGRTIATGSQDRSVRLWETGTGRDRTWLGEHAGAVTDLVFAADGSTLISAGVDGCVKFWRLAGGRGVREWKLPGPVHALSLAGDGRHLATGNGNGTVYITRLAPPPAGP